MHGSRSWRGGRFVFGAVVACVLAALTVHFGGLVPDERAVAAKSKGGSQLKVAKKLARQVVSAKSERAQLKALRKTLKALNLGVYTGTGKTVVQGRVRRKDDPYLYEFQLQMLAEALERDDRTSLDQLAAEISASGLATATGPLTGDELRKALTAGVKRATKQSRAPRSLATLLLAELGRQGKPKYDLANLKPKDNPSFDALQRLLVLADIALGVKSAEERATESRGSASCSVQGNKRIYRIGSFILGEIPVVSDVIKLPILSVWHAWVVGTGIDYRRVGDDFEAGHYGPRDHDEEDPTSKIAGEEIEFTIEVVMLDKPSENQIKCGALAGYRVPDQGPVEGIEIDWDGSSDDYEELLKHGTITREDAQTGGDGRATFRFRPRDEMFAGVGPVEHAKGSIGPEALIMNSLGNTGAVLENVAGRPQFFHWDVGFHAQTATVDATSQIKLPPRAYGLNCDGAQPDSGCTTSGETTIRVSSSIPVRWDPDAGSVTGRAPLNVDESSGEVTMTTRQGCGTGGGQIVNKVTHLGTATPGELVVTHVAGGIYRSAQPVADVGIQMLTASLEDIRWTQKTCDGSGTALDGLEQQHAQWPIHWTQLHSDEQTGQLRWQLGNFSYNGSIFERVYQRTRQVSFYGGYPVPEDTKFTVTPRG